MRFMGPKGTRQWKTLKPMYVEYCNYNKYIEDYGKEVSQIFRSLEKDVNGVAVPINMVSELRELLPEGIVIASPIDYPLGLGSTKVREHAVVHSFRQGANAVDFTLNEYLMKTSFSKVAEEIETTLRICKDFGATLRVFLEHRRQKNVSSFARFFHEIGVEVVFPTKGYHHDDFYDTMIACQAIEKKTSLAVIFNGFLWKEEQVKLIKDCDIFGLRLYDLKLV